MADSRGIAEAWRIEALDVFGQAPSRCRREAFFLGSDSNFHAKHPAGTAEGWWNLDSDPNKPGHTNTAPHHLAFNPQFLDRANQLMKAREQKRTIAAIAAGILEA